MNFRKGFGRIARVAAVAYWAVALTVVGVLGFDAYQRTGIGYADPPAPGWVDDTPFRIKVADGRTVVIEALNQDQAWLGAQVWAQKHPKPHTLVLVATDVGRGLGVAAILFAVLWAGYRAVRWVALGFLDRPTDSSTQG